MVAQQHFEVPELMFCVFRLLFQLSFVPENVTVLMRAQVAQLIVSAIDHEQHGKDERLMLTCISLLGNMAVTEPGCVPAMQEVCHACVPAVLIRAFLFASFKYLLRFLCPLFFCALSRHHTGRHCCESARGNVSAPWKRASEVSVPRHDCIVRGRADQSQTTRTVRCCPQSQILFGACSLGLAH